ncbi:hypothetical protein RclHR1_32390004 [Rhizophagus clarus]|uniref:Uncharacterized protein n=1 Tax=Rhizophagus clarus TaxID=94130 RepID=A0A2Z6R8E7_9GLOM|nr:hypothetical protein RclHR1_32390004 [Rhizophagus clarus]
MIAQELKTGETSVEWSEDFHDIVRLVNEKWQRDPPKILEGPPKIDKNTELLLEGTLVRTKLLEPISVLGKKIHGTNKALKDSLYKKFLDLADKKEKAFAYQVEIEKIMLQGGFVYKKDGVEKNRILDNIRILANRLDPYEIPTWFEEPIWQPDYWEDEDPDNPANWQSEYSEDLSDSDEDPDYPYLESVEWI